MRKIKGKQLEVPENEDPQKEMEELKKIIYDFIEKRMKEKEDINMSRVKELFDVEIGEKFSIDCGDCEYYNCSFVLNGEWAELIRPFGPDKNRRDKQEEARLLEGLAYGKYKIIKAKKPVLDDVEKKFLGNLIRPFEVDYIYKGGVCFGEKMYILIRLTNGEAIDLPYFSSTSGMYKGMETGKAYIPEELGL